eukprot:SAG11_NODE_1549_length_4701_cov_1.707518_3_plen_441_part_00
MHCERSTLTAAVCTGCAGIPQGDFALNLFTEYSPIRPRILLGAAAQKYASDAYLYYATNGWSQYAQGPTWSWDNISETMNVQYMRQENATYDGQGQLIIPASPKSRYNGFAATMQLEGVRDGLEDRALYIKLEGLLQRARATGRNTRAVDAAVRALEVPSAIVRSLNEGAEPGYIANERFFTEDPVALRSHWLDVVKAIQGLEREAATPRGTGTDTAVGARKAGGHKPWGAVDHAAAALPLPGVDRDGVDEATGLLENLPVVSPWLLSLELCGNVSRNQQQRWTISDPHGRIGLVVDGTGSGSAATVSWWLARAPQSVAPPCLGCLGVQLSRNQSSALKFEYLAVGRGNLGGEAKACIRRYAHGACALSGLCLNNGWSDPGSGPESAVFLGGCDDVDGVETWVQNQTVTPRSVSSTLISMSSPCGGPRCETRQCLTAVAR